MTIRFLFLGDVVSAAACREIARLLPVWRREWALDCVVVNGENAVKGRGITPAVCADLYDAGVDCITTGNHVWDQREIIPHIEKDDRLLRPLNLSDTMPGRGSVMLRTESGAKVLVVNMMLRLFMFDMVDDPFVKMQDLLQKYTLGRDVQSIIVDVHGEATSEMQAFGHHFDGRVSVVVGTHTHVPTSDYQILPGGTAFQTDAGMCGCYDSVLGFQKEGAINRFRHKVPKPPMDPDEDERVTLAGLFVELDEKTGLAVRVEQVLSGGVLRQSLPFPNPAGSAAVNG